MVDADIHLRPDIEGVVFHPLSLPVHPEWGKVKPLNPQS